MKRKYAWPAMIALAVTAAAVSLYGYYGGGIRCITGAGLSDALYRPAQSSVMPEKNSVPAEQVRQKENSRRTATATGTAAPPSYSKHGWGIKRNDRHEQPEMPSGISSTLARYGAYWIGKPGEKAVYLTFDEGYENGYTPKILDILKTNRVKAAFFVTGHYLKSQPELVKRMVAEGHIVGNHTMNHPSLPDISDEQIKTELQSVDDLFNKLTGKKMHYLRPPKGEYSEHTLALTRDLGYHNIFWSLALVDWVPMPGGAEEAYRSVMDNLHPGALILLHAVSKDDTEALDRIIKDIKAQGYSFKTLDDLTRGN